MAILVDRLVPSAVRGHEIYWLLDLEFAGRTFRIADAELDVQTADGDWLHYSDGLGAISVTESLALHGDSSGQLSVPLEVYLPGDVSVAELVAAGHRLSAAKGTLCRWVEGTTREEARTVLVGRARQPQYGSDDEPVAMSLEEVVADEAGLVGSPLARVDGYTWEHADSLNPEHLGLQYPIILGQPGRLDTSVAPDGWTTGSAAVWADYRATPGSGGHTGHYTEVRAVVAGHHVSATTVYALTDSSPATRFVVRNGYDARGQPIAYLPWFVSSIPTHTDDEDYVIGDSYTDYTVDAYGTVAAIGATPANIGDIIDSVAQPILWIGWRDELDASAGGLMADGQTVRRALDAAAYVLGWTTLDVDHARFAAESDSLSAFLVDAMVEERVQPWAWIRDCLLPVLPVTLASGPNGIYPIVVRYGATAADATVFVGADSDPDIERVSPVTEDDEDVCNRIALRYGYSLRRQAYTASVTLGAPGDAPEEVDGQPDTTFRTHPLCAASRARMGVTVDLELSSPVICDTATAWAVVTWMAQAFALPRRMVDYRVPEVDYVHVQRGAVATLTDPDVHLLGQVALVSQVVTDGSGYLTLTFLLLEDPLRDLRGGGA